MAEADRALEELLKRRVELRKKWDDLEDRAGEAILREEANIEELERLEASTLADSVAELDLPDQGFIGQDVLQMSAYDWAMIDHLDPAFFSEFASQSEVRL